MGNFLKKHTKNQQYDKEMIIYMQKQQSMEVVHEIVEYIRECYPANTSYNQTEFIDIFNQYFDKWTEYAFKQLADQSTQKVDIYEILALISLVNNSEYERKLDFLFRLFDTDQSEELEITEFILTAHACIKALTKIVGIQPPSFSDISQFVQLGYFREADENQNNSISLEEFIKFVSTSWQFSDWLCFYANMQTFENAERKCMEQYFFYQKLFNLIDGGKDILPTQLMKLIKKEKPDVKEETAELLEKALIGTSKYLNPNIKDGYISQIAYNQVIKAWSAFDGCDISQDNKIDADELKFLIFAYDKDKPDDQRVLRDLKEIDKNKTGYVTRQEWIEYMCTTPNVSQQMTFRQNLKEQFNRYDTDNSGYLDSNELQKVLKDNLKELTSIYQVRGGEDLKIYNGMIEEIVLQIIDELDKDGDKKCSWTEFKQFIDMILERQDKLKKYIESFN